MRFILFTIFTALLVVFANPYIPYWGVMSCIAVLSAIIFPKPFGAFMGGGLGMGLAWLGQSLYIGITTSSTLPDQMSQIMGLSSGMSLVALTGALGFLLGAFSGWTGSLFRKMTMPRPKNIYKG